MTKPLTDKEIDRKNDIYRASFPGDYKLTRMLNQAKKFSALYKLIEELGFAEKIEPRNSRKSGLAAGRNLVVEYIQTQAQTIKNKDGK